MRVLLLAAANFALVAGIIGGGNGRLDIAVGGVIVAIILAGVGLLLPKPKRGGTHDGQA